MARLIEPGEEQLPAGPERDLVLALHEAHRAAGSPSFRRIERAVSENDDYPDTVSRETMSQLFKGEFVPRWAKVECVVRQLAVMSSPRRDPEVKAARFLQLWTRLGGADVLLHVKSQDVPAPRAEPVRSSVAVSTVGGRPAGRYDDGTQVLPHGGLAQLDHAIARLTADEYQRGWGDGLRFVEDLSTWDVLDDLAGHDFDVRGWIAARRAGWHHRMAASGQGEAVLPSWWSAAAGYLGRIADPFGLEEYRYGRSARYLAGFADALRAAWFRGGGETTSPPSPAVVSNAAARRAVELIDLQLAELAAAAAPDAPQHRPDEQAYQSRHAELQHVLDQLQVPAPFPWTRVATAVAALKAQFRGNGAYGARRGHLRQLRDTAVAQLSAHLAATEDPWPTSVEAVTNVVAAPSALPQWPDTMVGYEMQVTGTATVRVFADAAPVTIPEFPATMNGCAHQRFLIRWRTFGGARVSAQLVSTPDLVPDSQPAIGTAGWISTHGCLQPAWSNLSADSLEDVVASWQVWRATA